MRAALNRIAKVYFHSAWLPSFFALAVFGLLVVNGLNLHLPFVDLVLLVMLATGLLGVLISGIVQLVKGNKLWGAINMLAFPLVVMAVFWGFGMLMFVEMLDDKPDNFGKNIVIPADMKVSDPVETFEEPGGPVADGLTRDLITAFATNSPPSNNTRVPTDFAVLNEFATTNREKLIQYLSASPCWFVTEEMGKPYAYRRFVTDGRWQNNLNGFYGGFDLAPTIDPYFQIRVVIGFNGPVFEEPFRRIATEPTVGAGTVPLRVVEDKEANQGKQSYLVLRSSRAAVEIFEQSELAGRPATELALAAVKRELESALVSSSSMGSSMASDQTKGAPTIELAKGMQGGIYEVRAFANPGEAGKVYIKVFEATQNTPLSENRIKPASISRMGWSTNANAKFRYQSEVTVYEGDWGNYYPGRFELWFVPDSGKPERKLVDRIFRIDGWMR